MILTSSGRVFTDQITEYWFAAPRRLAALIGVDFFEECWKNFRFVVCGAACDENVVWMPVDWGDSGFDWFFYVFTDPPIVRLFEVANVDQLCATTNREFVLFRWPSHTSRRSIYSKKHQRWPPITIWIVPNVGIQILKKRNFIRFSLLIEDILVNLIKMNPNDIKWKSNKTRTYCTTGNNLVCFRRPVEWGDFQVMLDKRGILGPFVVRFIEEMNFIAIWW